MNFTFFSKDLIQSCWAKLSLTDLKPTHTPLPRNEIFASGEEWSLRVPEALKLLFCGQGHRYKGKQEQVLYSMASCRACLWSTYCARPWWRPWQTLLYTHSAHHLLRVIAMNQTDTQINRISSFWEAPWRKGAPKVVPWGWGSGELLWGSLFIAGAAKTKDSKTQNAVILNYYKIKIRFLWLRLMFYLGHLL